MLPLADGERIAGALPPAAHRFLPPTSCRMRLFGGCIQTHCSPASAVKPGGQPPERSCGQSGSGNLRVRLGNGFCAGLPGASTGWASAKSRDSHQVFRRFGVRRQSALCFRARAGSGGTLQPAKAGPASQGAPPGPPILRPFPSAGAECAPRLQAGPAQGPRARRSSLVATARGERHEGTAQPLSAYPAPHASPRGPLWSLRPQAPSFPAGFGGRRP